MIPTGHGEIASDEFVDSFMTEIRIEIYPQRKSLPNYEHYTKTVTEWSAIKRTLDESFFRAYDDVLTLAFIDYEKLISEFFWTLGLVDAVNQRIQDMTVIETGTDLPDPSGVESNLNRVCEHYISRLEEKYRAKCSEHLRVWKEWASSGRYLYYKHGVEFTQKLLGRMAPNRYFDGA